MTATNNIAITITTFGELNDYEVYYGNRHLKISHTDELMPLTIHSIETLFNEIQTGIIDNGYVTIGFRLTPPDDEEDDEE